MHLWTLEDLVLDAIANDYENVKAIAEDVRHWGQPRGITATQGEFIDVLLRFLREGLAKAYKLTVNSAERVDGVVPEEAEQYYYLLTDRGSLRLSTTRAVGQTRNGACGYAASVEELSYNVENRMISAQTNTTMNPDSYAHARGWQSRLQAVGEGMRCTA